MWNADTDLLSAPVRTAYERFLALLENTQGEKVAVYPTTTRHQCEPCQVLWYGDPECWCCGMRSDAPRPTRP